MRSIVAITAAILLSCSATYAQTSMSTPGIGATSPLGIPGSSGATGTGIPMGATEIDPGGLGVVPGATNSTSGCISTGTLPGSGTTTTSTTSTSSTFDG